MLGPRGDLAKAAVQCEVKSTNAANDLMAAVSPELTSIRSTAFGTKGGNWTFAAICTNVCSAEDLAPTGAIPKAAFCGLQLKLC